MDNNNLIPDPSQIDSWPKALAFVFQVAIMIGLPLYLKRAHDAVKQNTAMTAETNTTLTERNGGSSVRDTLDEIKAVVYSVNDKVDAVSIRVSNLEGHGKVTEVTENNGTVTIETKPLPL